MRPQNWTVILLELKIWRKTVDRSVSIWQTVKNQIEEVETERRVGEAVLAPCTHSFAMSIHHSDEGTTYV